MSRGIYRIRYYSANFSLRHDVGTVSERLDSFQDGLGAKLEPFLYVLCMLRWN